jgi:hypothetical protein
MSSKYYQINEFIGGGLRGYVTASYSELYGLFGAPTRDNASSDGKVSTQWNIKGPRCEFTLYDYRDVDCSSPKAIADFRARESYEWHIGGRVTPKQIAAFKKWLERALRREVDARAE